MSQVSLEIKELSFGKNVLPKILSAFLLIILIFLITRYTEMPFEELVWGALALLIVGILCYSIFKELREDTRLIRDREDWIDTIFRKISYPSSIFYVDANCIIQYANDEFGKLRGFMCRDEILGKTPEEILGVEKSIIRGVLETGEVIINRRRDPIINYKGEILHHLISCIPIKNKVGKIIGALETLTNITKRVNQEELTHSILKNIPYPSSLFFVDTNCIISYASDEFAKLRGFAKGEDVIGKEPEEILGVEKSIIRGVIGRDKAIINQIRGPIIDYKGNKLYHLISCIPIKDSGGKLLGALEVLTDITELRRHEELIHQLIRKIPDPVHLIFIDKNKKIRYVDDTFAKFVGVESSEELIGKRIGEVLDTKDIKRPIAETVIDKREPVLNKEIRLKKIEPEEEIKRDEQFIHLLYSCVPVESVDGELLGALEVFVDLTEMERRYKLQECESYDTS